MPGFDWPKLTSAQKEDVARAYRKDLAYAAGITGSQVMDESGRPGCVSLAAVASFVAAKGRLLTESTGTDLLAQACLPIPEGATVADIEAVVTSGTQKRKIVDDFMAADGELKLRPDDVKISVTPQDSCVAVASAQKPMEAFCAKGSVEETTTLQPTSSATQAATTQPSTTKTGEATTRPHLLSMPEFLHRMGAAERDSPRDAFAALDANGDDFSDLAEFEGAAKGFHPPLDEPQSKNMFDWLDTNHDGRLESMEFFEALNMASTSQQPFGSGPAPITLTQYRRSLGHQMRYTKIGVGLCRTAAEAWPGSEEHPEAITKEACLGECSDTATCGAFAFKLGGTCRLYPEGQEYPDTTPMTDVECFIKGFTDEAEFDLARIQLLFFVAQDVGELTEADAAAAGAKLAEGVAFEVGAPLDNVRSIGGMPSTCSFRTGNPHPLDRTPGASKSYEAICIIDVPAGRRIEDLAAVIAATPTKDKFANDLSSLPEMPKFTAASIEASVHGTSAQFRTVDADQDGSLSLAEFVQATKGFNPPLSQIAAQYAFKGLDMDQDSKLSADEFEANGMHEFFKPSSQAFGKATT